MQISTWLHGWCGVQGFGFHDHGTLFDDSKLLERGGTYLTRKGKGISANRLANLVK